MKNLVKQSQIPLSLWNTGNYVVCNWLRSLFRNRLYAVLCAADFSLPVRILYCLGRTAPWPIKRLVHFKNRRNKPISAGFSAHIFCARPAAAGAGLVPYLNLLYAFGAGVGGVLSPFIPSTIAESALIMPLASYGINILLAVPSENFGSISRYLSVINSLSGFPA